MNKSKYYNIDELEEMLNSFQHKEYVYKEYVDKKLFNEATIEDFIKKFGIEKILESIGEDKIQNFIRLKKIKKLKKDMK